MSAREEVLIIGHRGASADRPENTVSAFFGALSQGADWVELDVRATADGALIVHHDPWYRDQRTVWTTPAAERPAGVPLLSEALDACAGMGVNIEIKNIPGDLGGDDVPWSLGVADAVVGEVEERRTRGVTDVILISTFDFATLTRVRELAPELPTAYLVLDPAGAGLDGHDGGDAAGRAAASGCVAVHPWEPCVDETLVRRCHALGLAVNVWTVDDPVRIRQLADLGVDGVVTNVPAIARAALRPE